jgi:hypothetical protein
MVLLHDPFSWSPKIIQKKKKIILDSRLREKDAFSFAYQNHKMKDRMNTTASRETHWWMQNTSLSPVCWLWATPVSLHLHSAKSTTTKVVRLSSDSYSNVPAFSLFRTLMQFTAKARFTRERTINIHHQQWCTDVSPLGILPSPTTVTIFNKCWP